MITIKDEVIISRVNDQIKKITRAFGKNTKLNPSDYCTGVIKKHLDKKDHDIRSNNKTTDTVEWGIWRRENFRFILERDKRKCVYCKKFFSSHAKDMTLDHDIPVCRGGNLTHIDNVVLACRWCNHDKGVLTKEEYAYKQLMNAAKGIYPPK